MKIKVDVGDLPRLDRYLDSLKIAPSRSQVQKWIEEAFVLVNGQASKVSTKLKLGDEILINKPKPQSSEISAEKLPLKIIYEDDDCIVINKSPLMVVHPAAGHPGGTLVNALMAHTGSLSTIGGVHRPGLVHRLDKGSSGVMIIAKNDKSHQSLSDQFQSHEVEKIYWALVYGSLKQTEGRLESFINRHPKDRKKYGIHPDKGKWAVTDYKVINEAKSLSLLKVQIHTGRTHQIRVHLSDLGYPIVADDLYGGGKKRIKSLKSSELRQKVSCLEHPLLHSRSLKIKHPRSHKEMKWTADLPDDFKDLLDFVFE